MGQRHLLGPDSLLRQAVELDQLSSLILWGPPGSGKTTLARIVANLTSAHFCELSATGSGVAAVRTLIEEASGLREQGKKTVLFLDEIHRFNKAQQDALLPAVEDGRLVLIGATTENPYFEVNSPLLSRCRILRFEPLADGEIRTLLLRAVGDGEAGFGGFGIEVEPEALDYLVRISGGDARIGLTGLEAAVESLAARLGVVEGGTTAGAQRRVTPELAEEAVGRTALLYDRDGDAHYDTVSAFIKSMRGSDPDASLYWLAKMLEAGEDPEFIARRMIIFASEDVGLADSRALEVAMAAAQALQYVGLPEARLNLAHAALYMATSPKSNSVIRGIGAAAEDVRREASRVPAHLRDAHYPGASKLGHGKGYRYPHGYPRHWVAQEYLPDNLRGRRYYEPSAEGLEGRRWEAHCRRIEEEKAQS